MNLLIDIGNSRIKWCLYDSIEDTFYLDGAMSHKQAKLSDLFYGHWGQLDCPSSIFISNVSGQKLAKSLDLWLVKTWQIKAQYVKTEAFNFGVSNGYSNYIQLGVDRWMVILAGWQRFSDEKKAVCVVDCGTAMTIDGISNTGQHLGGFILPGYAIMQDVLMNKTADIERFRKISPKKRPDKKNQASIYFSNSTEESMNSGCYLAMISAIDKAVILMQADYGKQINCIITGGNAKLVIDHLTEKFVYEPALVLHGLAVFSKQRS